MTLIYRENVRRFARWALAATFLAAGVLHIHAPRPFIAITPSWVPHPEAVIFVTGLCEIAGAAGLMIPRLRRLAGIMLALYALCVFPANVHHAFAHISVGKGPPLDWWYHGPRLAFQPVIIWWCLFAGGAVDWPLTRVRPASSPRRANP